MKPGIKTNIKIVHFTWHFLVPRREENEQIVWIPDDECDAMLWKEDSPCAQWATCVIRVNHQPLLFCRLPLCLSMVTTILSSTPMCSIYKIFLPCEIACCLSFCLSYFAWDFTCSSVSYLLSHMIEPHSFHG